MSEKIIQLNEGMVAKILCLFVDALKSVIIL